MLKRGCKADRLDELLKWRPFDWQEKLSCGGQEIPLLEQPILKQQSCRYWHGRLLCLYRSHTNAHSMWRRKSIGGKAMFCCLAFSYNFRILFTHHDVIAVCDILIALCRKLWYMCGNKAYKIVQSHIEAHGVLPTAGVANAKSQPPSVSAII